MKTGVGLWIDHRKAVLVAVTGQGEKIRLIKSNVEKQIRPAGDSRSKTSYGPQDTPPDDMRERAFMGHLNSYFDKVISCIGDVKSILIFGPGEAKRELKKRIDGNQHVGNIVDVETADKMTDRQIVANVRRRFQVPVQKSRLNRRGGFIHQGYTSQLQRPDEKMDDLNSEITIAEIESASRKRAESAAVSKAHKILMEQLIKTPIAVDEGVSRWEGEGGPAVL